MPNDRELEAACRISELLFQTTDMEELLVTTLRCALDEVGAEAGSILLADPETKQLVFRHSIGEKPVPQGTAIPWDKGIAGKVFQSVKAEIVRNVQHEQRHYGAIDQMTGLTTRDMITLPLKRWKGEPIGVLNVLNKREGVLDQRDAALLTIISAFAALSIEQARLYEEARLAEVVRLLGNVGHDLKNLLQPVVSGTGLLKDELSEILEHLQRTDPERAQRSQGFCNEVLALIQRTTGRIHERVKEIADCVKGLSAPPEFAPCAVTHVVEDVFQTLRVMAAEKKVELKTAGLTELPMIQADASRLYNAFYNLVNNAIPEVPEGGSVTVSGQMVPDGKAVMIQVADTGRGMPPEVCVRLFTARALSTKKSGTGLGTKIVKDVIDAHRGVISVESRPGAGTVFHIRLHLDPAKAESGKG
jgi:signal transduction histidine kinase